MEALANTTTRVIPTLDALESLVGQEVALSGWHLIASQQVRQFAEATGDRQWIHLDEARCLDESPYGRPIAHGYLTLSMIQMLMADAVRLPPARLEVNYGLNRLRFPAPTFVGDRVRARLSLKALDRLEDHARMVWTVAIEGEAGGKPVCVAEPVFLRYNPFP